MTDGREIFIRFNMMLKSFFKAWDQRGLFAGTALGASFPVLMFAIEADMRGASAAMRLMLSEPLHILSFAVPMLSAVLCERLAESRRRLKDLASQRDMYERRLVLDAHYDALTGLPNRRMLEADLEEMTARREPGAFLVIDIDKFKFVNDTMGHEAGDDMLRRIGDLVREALGPDDRLYRIGGDEFVAVLPGVTQADAVEATCKTIAEAVRQPLDLPQGRVAAGLSIGITFLAPGESDGRDAFKRADLALYRAKEVSGSSYAFFDAELAAAALERIEIERDMLRALADGEFYVEYQPILNIVSGRVMSFEALLRWCHPVKGRIPPDRFIPLAEKTGLILPLGRWVLGEACREAAGWPGEAGVAINVSGDQFKDSGFVEYVGTVLAQTGLAANRLTIEVTESVFTVDVQVIQTSLNALRAMGVKIALDDFGTGFSSINNLKLFPLDHLKIDRSFTEVMLRGGSDSELVSLMSRLGDAFQLSTTIEGIETERQFEFARLMGIGNVQGYLISRPVAAEKVIGLLVSECVRQVQSASAA